MLFLLLFLNSFSFYFLLFFLLLHLLLLFFFFLLFLLLLLLLLFIFFRHPSALYVRTPGTSAVALSFAGCSQRRRRTAGMLGS